MKALEVNANLAEVESRLHKYPYLSKNNLPGSPDGRVFIILEANKRRLSLIQAFRTGSSTPISTIGTFS